MKKPLALCALAALFSATVSATPGDVAVPTAASPSKTTSVAEPAQALPGNRLPTCGYICDSFGRCYRVCY